MLDYGAMVLNHPEDLLEQLREPLDQPQSARLWTLPLGRPSR